MLLEDFLESIYLPNRLARKSKNTCRLYRYSIRSFEKTICKKPCLEDLTNKNVSRHIDRVILSGKSAATANKDRSQLLALWRYAVKLGMKESWPEVQAATEPIRTPKAWLASDIQNLFAAIDRMDFTINKSPASLWWKSLLMTCLDTGERIGALLAVEWNWLEGDWVNIPAEFRKGGKRDKSYKLSRNAITLLRKLRTYRTSRKIWFWPYNEMYIWKKFGEILEDAGLPSGRSDKFHRLRKTCASVIHAAGLDATEALDHTHRRTTQRYLDPRFRKESQPCRAIEEWLQDSAKKKELA